MKGCKEVHDCDGSELDRETFSLHDKLSAQLSLCSTNGALLTETAATPGPDMEVPSDILHWPIKILNQNPDEEVTKWMPEKNGFSFVLSDSELYAEFSYDSSVSEQSSINSSPCMSQTAYSDTQSEDLDRRDIWVSSLDLDEEDSALLPDKEQFLDILSSDFPSPSFRAMRSLQLCPSSSSPGTSKEEVSSFDDPIFWPFDFTSYYSSEFNKFLSVSPRQNTLGIRYGQVHQLNPVQRLQKNKLSSAMKCREPYRSSIHSASKRTNASQDKIQNADIVRSRHSRPPKTSASSKQQPVRNCEKKRPPHIKIGTSRKVSYPQFPQDTRTGKIRSLVNKSTIEELIGLDEFNGHEGISSNSEGYEFSLWLSPR